MKPGPVRKKEPWTYNW